MKKSTRTEKMGPLHAVAIETEAEKERFNRLLDGGHYQKSRQPSGHTLYQAVLDDLAGKPRRGQPITRGSL